MYAKLLQIKKAFCQVALSLLTYTHQRSLIIVFLNFAVYFSFFYFHVTTSFLFDDSMKPLKHATTDVGKLKCIHCFRTGCVASFDLRPLTNIPLNFVFHKCFFLYFKKMVFYIFWRKTVIFKRQFGIFIILSIHTKSFLLISQNKVVPLGTHTLRPTTRARGQLQ